MFCFMYFSREDITAVIEVTLYIKLIESVDDDRQFDCCSTISSSWPNAKYDSVIQIESTLYGSIWYPHTTSGLFLHWANSLGGN